MINQSVTTAPALIQRSPSQKNPSETKITDQSDKQQTRPISSTDSQKVLNEKLVDSIDKVLQKSNAAPIRTLDAQEYTPKAVSDRILGFVQDAIGRAESRGENRNELMALARQGIDKGFQDAKNILSSLNALSGKIAENVQSTYDLIQGGLGQIAKNKSSVIEQNVNLSAFNQSSSQSLSLDIKTRDGDIVTLSLQKNQSTGSYQAQLQNGESKTTYSEFNFKSSDNFSIAIQGVLDEDESIAIKELLGNVKNVADQFFSGNASAAFEAGLNLGFNSKELASFSLSLDQSQTQSVTQAYREISGYSDAADYSRSPVNLENLLTPIRDFMKSLEATLFDATNSSNLESNAVKDMFNFFARAEESYSAMIDQLQSLTGKPFENIAEDIISQIKN